MNLRRIIILAFILFLSPHYAFASGGGPLLLLFNGSVFVIGQIWIIGIELLIYRRYVDIYGRDAFGDVFTANIFSTLAVAFGFSIVIIVVGLAGSFLPGIMGDIFPAIGTWAYDNAKYNKLAVYISFFWFALQSIITVYFESWVYKRRWGKRGYVSNVEPVKLCWYANTVSHIGLFLAILVIWHEII